MDAEESPVYKHLSTAYTLRCESLATPVKKINIDLNEIGFGDRIAYLLENVFTPEECQQLINHTEEIGYEPALIHFGDKAVLAKGYRDSHRVMVDDKKFSKILFKRIKNLLPPTFKSHPQANEYTLLEVNERLRFLRYDPGDSFKPHYDGYYVRPDGITKTWITLQIYLNEGMDGGETTFLQPINPHKDRSVIQGRVKVVPKTGMVLVFQHNILHEGSLVNNGRKYTIRTDVLYNIPDSDSETDIDSSSKTSQCTII